MAGNMESILLGSDDDSSDDSDNETMQEVAASTGVPAAAAVAATIQAPPAPAPVPVAQPPPAVATNATLSQNERLKSLYSPANKASKQQNAPVAAPVQPVHEPQQVPVANFRAQAPPQAQPTQRRNAIVQPPLPVANPQQPRQSSQSSASSGFRPLVPNPRPAAASQPSPVAQQASRPSASAGADPFEPTPLKTMIQRQQQKAQRQQQQQQQQVPPIHSPNAGMSQQPSSRANASTSSTASHASSTSTVVVSNTERSRAERDAKHRKERFLMFTRVLMKYLEQKDPAMHVKAKQVIKECAEKNKQKEPGYESVTSSMQTRLRAMVGNNYWERAEAYLNHFLKEKEKIEKKKSSSSSSSSSQQQTSQSSSALPSPSSSFRGSAGGNKTQQQLAQEHQLATQQKLEEIQREKEKVKQQAELQKRKNDEERRRAQQKKEQMHKEAVARIAARTAADQQAAAAAAAAAQAKKKKEHKRKGSGASAASAAAAARTMSPMPSMEKNLSREYNEMMQDLDHAVDYDWTSAALLLGKEARADVSLDTEQKFLLYGSSLSAPRPGVQAAQSAAPSSELPASMRGWGKKNVLSSRAAWARVRLREQREQMARSSKHKQAPEVGGLRLPSAQSTDEKPVLAPEAEWFNEEKAEEDKVLAVLSEGTEIYLKSILQKALTAARQRENLDGIRLWHLQHGPSKPPMSIRLGCDVNRQVAQVEGNAAKTVQRMEEALERQTNVPAKARALEDEETLYNATSMADLALRPKLANAAEEADENAKRSFQVYGGKESAECPPFGRVPKKPKITTQDFSLAREWTDYGHQRNGFATSQMM